MDSIVASTPKTIRNKMSDAISVFLKRKSIWAKIDGKLEFAFVDICSMSLFYTHF